MHLNLDPRKSIKIPFQVALIASFAGIRWQIAGGLFLVALSY